MMISIFVGVESVWNYGRGPSIAGIAGVASATVTRRGTGYSDGEALDGEALDGTPWDRVSNQLATI